MFKSWEHLKCLRSRSQKNQYRTQFALPIGDLERHTLNPISGSADLSHCGGQTKLDRVMFWLQERKRSKSAHDTPNQIPLLEDPAADSMATFGYSWTFIFVLLST